jgi:putative aminopeptidase FrvX
MSIDRDFLFKYLNNTSPTGFEAEGQKIWLEYLEPFIDEYFIDTYGTTVGIINPGADYKVVIEAHADEISWFVNYITEEGYIYVRRNGGSDAMIAPSKRVNIHSERGIVKGVFGWPAIHVRNEKEEEKPSMKNIFIDVGCRSKDEVHELGVQVGDVLTFDDSLTELANGFITGRAIDNRIGGYMIAQAAKRIAESGRLDYSLYIVNAVQEEVGLRGAQMIANKIKPDVAIVTDVGHDTTAPMYNKILSGHQEAGKGPVLPKGPAVQNNLLKLLMEVAQQHNIPFQRAAATRATGTDTDAFAYSNEGVASALISLPLKYMHTTVETVHKDDIENVIELIFQFLKTIKAGQDFRYFQ